MSTLVEVQRPAGATDVDGAAVRVFFIRPLGGFPEDDAPAPASRVVVFTVDRRVVGIEDVLSRRRRARRRTSRGLDAVGRARVWRTIE
jgi:hypothetical protein